MIRKVITSSVVILFLVDQLVLVASLAVALTLKSYVILPDPVLPVRLHVDLFLHLWPFLALTLAFSGAYNLRSAVGGLTPLLRQTLVSVILLAGVWIAGTFYLKMSELFTYSRMVFTLFLGSAAVGLLLARVVFAHLSTWWQARAGAGRRVLIFGGDSLGSDIAEHLRKQIFAPVRSIEATGDVNAPGVSRLSEEDALLRIRQGEVDQVILDLPPRRTRLLLRVAQMAEREGVPLQITPSIFPGLHLIPRVDQIGETPVIEMSGHDLPLSGMLAKRAFDVTASGVGLILLAPLFAVVAPLIKLTSRGPIFYLQERVGLDGKRFRMVKFRTMRADAEQETGPVWACDNDPRATRVGRLLRKTNVDELPQLFNVLVGQMSLVGPRPERPEFVQAFKHVISRYSHKHWVKPGITGWAQVNGWRGRTDLHRRIQHDIHYVENWSFWFDLWIISLTLLRLVKKRKGKLDDVNLPAVDGALSDGGGLVEFDPAHATFPWPQPDSEEAAAFRRRLELAEKR